MINETPQKPQPGLTFDDVWLLFKETDRQIKEIGLQMDRQIKETDRQFKETDRQFKETDRQFKETDRKISKLGSRIGELVEELFFPNIRGKFSQLGYIFGKAAPDVSYSDAQGRIIAEVDILLENEDAVLAVEVKTKLAKSDVWDHVRRMEKLRRYADEHQDRRKLLGAVAGAIAPDPVKAFAVENGFFVLEQSGDTVQISVPEGFEPKIW
jgi:hypothetical protein